MYSVNYYRVADPYASCLVMEQNIVKCNQCNLVISEILCFIQNKIDTMDEVSLIQICKSSFTEEDIKKAKSLLFQAIPNSKKMTVRKNKGKNVRDLEDIIELFKVTDPDVVPIFVVRELQRIPAVSFDHVDVSTLLKNILMLQSEVKFLKENFTTVTQVEEICKKYHFQDTQPLEQSTMENINMNRGGYLLEDSSYLEMCEPRSNGKVPANSTVPTGAMPDAHNCAKSSLGQGHTNASSPITRYTDDSVSLARGAIGAAEVRNVAAPARETAVSTNGVQSHAPTRPQCEARCAIAEKPVAESSSYDKSAVEQAQLRRDFSKTWANVAKEGEWTTVASKNKKQSRFIGIKGKAALAPECRFKAADIRIPFYIYYVDKGASEKDIEDYVLSKTCVKIKPEKISMKQPKGYEAYKFLIPKNKLTVFMDENLWPEGVSFRQYITFRNKHSPSDGINK